MSTNFDPKNSPFCQIDTIKSWLPKEYHKQIDKIQRDIASEVPENPESLDYTMLVENDDQFFGRTFHTQAALEVLCLREIKDLTQRKKDFVVLELAGGIGLAFWKMVLASGGKGTCYFNEVTPKMLNKFDTTMIKRLSKEQTKNIVKIACDCFKILETHPKLKGKVDVLLIKNLEHFLNKQQMDALVKLVSQLLTPGGKLFTTAHSFINISKDHAVYRFYQSQLLKGSIYPGFLKYQQISFKIKEVEGDVNPPEIVEKSVAIPKEYELCSVEPDEPEYDHEGYIHGLEKVCKVYKLKQTIVSMHFTPEMYERVYSQKPSLKVVKTFYMDRYGREQKEMSNGTVEDKFSSLTTNCCAIIEKKDPFTTVMDWLKKLPIQIIQASDGDSRMLIKGTSFGCAVETEEKNWENRLRYIETVIKDVMTNCPNDKPLTIVSQGSDRLAIEYLLYLALFKMGYSNLSIIPIDPRYKYLPDEELKVINSTLKEFREAISNLNGTGFNQDRIRFLSSTKNVEKYFSQQSNVIVIDCFPPYSKTLEHDLIKANLKPANKETFIATNYIVPSSDIANGIAIFPDFVNPVRYEQRTTVPLVTFNQGQFYIDCGCKIKPDGTYSVFFNQIEDYFERLYGSDDASKSSGISSYKKIEEEIRNMLDSQIKEMKRDGITELNQKQIGLLLDEVKKIAESHQAQTRFVTDYSLDQDAMVSYLAKNAGDYAKLFRHSYGAGITIEPIPHKK